MRVILFDIDGTLVDSAGAGRRAMNRAFADLHGIAGALDGITLHGRTDPLIVRDAFERRLGRPPTTQEVGAIIDKLVAYLGVELQNSPSYRVLPGVREILEELHSRDDILLGLGTGNAEPAARLKLSHGGIWNYFRFGGYGSDSATRSEIVRIGVERGERLLGDGRHVKEIWVVGDTPSDVEAGKAVGAKTLVTATGMHTLETLQACEPDLTVPDLSDVPFITGILLGRI